MKAVAEWETSRESGHSWGLQTIIATLFLGYAEFASPPDIPYEKGYTMGMEPP